MKYSRQENGNEEPMCLKFFKNGIILTFFKGLKISISRNVQQLPLILVGYLLQFCFHCKMIKPILDLKTGTALYRNLTLVFLSC